MVKQMCINARSLRRDVGANAHGTAGQLVSQFESTQVEILPGPGQQGLKIFQERRHDELEAVTAKMVKQGAAQALAQLAEEGVHWGFFRVRLGGRSRLLPLIARCMWWRSRLTGIATGDQGLFVTRELFAAGGGYPAQALMEDIEICRRLGAIIAGRALDIELQSSGRRWDRDGALRTIALMWWLRLRYFLGASPTVLRSDRRRGLRRGRASASTQAGDRGAEATTADITLDLRLAVRQPFAGEEVVRFLATRAIPGVEVVDAAGAYHRVLTLPHGPAIVSVRPDADHDTDADPDAYPDPDPHADAYADAYTDADCDQYPDPNADAALPAGSV